MGAVVSSTQAERSSAAPCGLLRRTVTTRERLDCAGRDWEGHDFHSCRKDPLTLVIPSEARNLLFSVPDFYGIQPQFKNPNATQRRFRGRNNDSPARKYQLRNGSRSRAPPPNAASDRTPLSGAATAYPAANATPPDSSPTARTCTQHPDRTSNSCIPRTLPPGSHTTQVVRYRVCKGR